ncbi:AIPR family protein [Rhizobium leguminosarum]|uniref:AIPR family protein n=1 Tax=Rhizobium leguminosarum TaxID=384 RepID=UPI0036DF9317
MTGIIEAQTGDARVGMVLSELAGRVEDEVLARKNSDRPFRPEIFLELMLEEYLPSRGLPDAQLGSHSSIRGNARLSVGGAVVSDDGKQLVLLNADYRSAVDPWDIPRPALIALSAQTVRFLKDVVTNSVAAPLTPDARAVAELIKQAWAKVETVIVVLFSDGVFKGKDIALESFADKPIQCEVFDIRSLSRLTDRTARDVSVPFVDAHGKPIRRIFRGTADASYECSLLIVPGDFLARLYQEYDVALLEYNVRAFLGSSNKVNAGMRKTLKANPERFLAYNNGLSATAREVELTEDGSAINHVSGLQIVNGGQTLAALHHVMFSDKVDISRVEVALKLTIVREADEPSFVGELSSYANTQSIVQIADFSANRPFHIEIERLSRSVWIPGEKGLWFFERTRGQYNVAQLREGASAAAKRRFKIRCPPARKFSKTDLAKFINAWTGLPHFVCNGAQYNYQSWLEVADQLEWIPDEQWYKDLISQAIIFKAAQKAVREGNYPGYRAQIVAYLVALIGDRIGSTVDLQLIWQKQAVSAELQNLLSLWAKLVEIALIETAERLNVTQWCKRSECWAKIKARTTPPIELALPEQR